MVSVKNNDANKILIGSKAFVFFLAYVLFIWTCEIADLIFFFISNKYNSKFFYLSRIILFAAFVFAFYQIFKHKKIIFEKNHKVSFFYAGAVFILLFGISKCIIPDGAFDTCNYHILDQYPGFTNYFVEGFGAGNFQSWGFRLSDRLFFAFNRLLGYRMGTLLNTIILIIAYYQLCQIFYQIKANIIHDGKFSNLAVELVALLSIMQYKNAMDLGLYYVDIVAFPIGLEVIGILIRAMAEKPAQKQILYFAILNGLWFAMKMTNIVYILPVIIIFIIVCRARFISLGTYFKSAIACVLPCTPYLIFDYYCTGNPVFPYFNKIFKSKYFMIENWKDTRWGGQHQRSKNILVYNWNLSTEK